jgi:tight adherence protein B
MPILIALIFGLVAIAVFAFGWWLDQRRARARLLHTRLAYVRKAAGEDKAEELAILRDVLLSEIPAVDKLLRRSVRIGKLQQFLAQAHVNLRAGRFLFVVFATIALFAVIGIVATDQLFVGILAGIFGASLPFLFVSHRRSKRFHQFEEDFPEAIDLLARAVRAGHAFTNALELIGNEMSEPIAGEFRMLFEEQKFGMPIRDALTNLVARIPIIDVKFFVTAVMLQRETGGNLAEILDKLSYVIRERFKIHRQVRVYTAQGRLTMMILMGLPPLVVVVMQVTNPHFIRVLWVDPLGHLLVAIGIILQTVGFLIIRRIIAIEV